MLMALSSYNAGSRSWFGWVKARAIGIQVSLLSGRRCVYFFQYDKDCLEDVLAECARLLGLDEEQVLTELCLPLSSPLGKETIHHPALVRNFP